MIQIGDYATLRVLRFTDFGSYLDAGELGEVLLPRKYEPEDLAEGDEIRVFLYHDDQGRPVATTETPLATVGSFAALKVAAVAEQGVFLDWGLSRGLFLPFREERRPLREGETVVVRVLTDERTGRVMASARVDRFLDPDPGRLRAGDEVDLLLYAKTDLGFKAIVDGTRSGVLYRNEIFRPVAVGDSMKGWVLRVRDDGKIDLGLQAPGAGKVFDFEDELLKALRENGGSIPFGDDSPADAIRDRFGVSKKTFKKASGALFRRRLVVLFPERIDLA